MQIIAFPINQVVGMCITNGKRSFAANQATKYAPNLIKKTMKSCTLLFEYGKEYLPRPGQKLLLELLLMYSKVTYSQSASHRPQD
jgi:hypothetical protein